MKLINICSFLSKASVAKWCAGFESSQNLCLLIFFRYILNFLRDGGFREGTLPTDCIVVNELITEAEYYQLKGLVQLLEGKAETDTRDMKKPHRKIALRKW